MHSTPIQPVYSKHTPLLIRLVSTKIYTAYWLYYTVRLINNLASPSTNLRAEPGRILPPNDHSIRHSSSLAKHSSSQSYNRRHSNHPSQDHSSHERASIERPPQAHDLGRISQLNTTGLRLLTPTIDAPSTSQMCYCGTCITYVTEVYAASFDSS